MVAKKYPPQKMATRKAPVKKAVAAKKKTGTLTRAQSIAMGKGRVKAAGIYGGGAKDAGRRTGFGEDASSNLRPGKNGWSNNARTSSVKTPNNPRGYAIRKQEAENYRDQMKKLTNKRTGSPAAARKVMSSRKYK